MNKRRAKLIILISGEGTNLQAIIDAIVKQELKADISAVIANRSSVFGLVRAHQANIPAFAFVKKKQETRQAYDNKLAEFIEEFAPDLIILAGWMHLLSNDFLRKFPKKVINLHPSLPGMFVGKNAIEEAWQAYEKRQIKETGVMIHYVPDDGIDSGPLISQCHVPIYPTDNLKSLTERIHKTEHSLLVESLKNWITTSYE